MNTHLQPYAVYLASWPAEAGAKPTSSILKTVHTLGGSNAGSGDALVVAMAMRKEGVHQGQVKAVLGKPHRNKLRALIWRGQAVVLTSQQGRHRVYRVKLK